MVERRGEERVVLLVRLLPPEGRQQAWVYCIYSVYIHTLDLLLYAPLPPPPCCDFGLAALVLSVSFVCLPALVHPLVLCWFSQRGAAIFQEKWATFVFNGFTTFTDNRCIDVSAIKNATTEIVPLVDMFVLLVAYKKQQLVGHRFLQVRVRVI